MTEAAYRYRKPDVLGRIRTDRHAVIEASAGTGKTFTLEHLLVELVLERDASIDQILVVTFTEKATREMRQRVRRKIEQILAREPATEIDPEPGAPAWTIDERARERLRRALFSFDRAPISTIHAFCQRVLTEHAFDSHRLFEQEQVEARQAFGRALAEELRIVLGEPGPLRVLVEEAIASSSVDQMTEDLFKAHVERGEIEPQCDFLAFEAALRQIPDRRSFGLQIGAMTRALKQVAKNWICVLEKLVAVRDHADEVDAVTSLRAVWAWAEEKANASDANPDYLRKYIERLDADPSLAPLRRAIEELVMASASPAAFLISALLPRVRARLDATKRRRGQLDFDDMLVLVRDAVARPGSDALVAELRRRYRWALVDEFQDTDEVQWDIFRKLFFESPDGHTLFVIGDPKQAIYGFRGADVHTYHAAAEAIVGAGGALVPLAECFRSTERVIDGYNALLDGFFTGPNRYDNPVRCGDPRLRLVGADDRDLHAIEVWRLEGEPTKPRAIERRLAVHVADEIERLLSSGVRFVDRDGPRALRPSDVFVLTRKEAEGVVVGAALRRRGIPHSFFKQEGLFQTEEAADVRALLSALENPADLSRRLRVWLTPIFGVLLEDLPRCRALDPSHPLVERLFRWKDLADRLEWGQLFTAVIEESGLVRRELFQRDSERSLTNYLHLFELLLEETHRRRVGTAELSSRLDDFIAKRALPPGENGNVQRLEGERDAVQILTMHKAKGLEAAVVFVVGGLTSRPPGANELRVYHENGRRRAFVGRPPERTKALVEQEQAEEAQRLLYVALTRAKARLYLPWFGDPKDGSKKPIIRVSGDYEPLQARLTKLAGTSADARCFAMRDVAPPADDATPEDALLDAWAPDAALLAPLPDRDPELDALRRASAGFVITSYARMKRIEGSGYHAPEDADREELLTEAVDAPALETPTRDLPGGTGAGVFLHSVLEALANDGFALVREGSGVRPLDPFDADPAVRDLVARFARRSGIAERHLARARALIHAAVTKPIPLFGSEPVTIALVERHVAEMSMLYPIPEGAHPPLGAAGPDRPLVVERGLVRGVVDLVLEHARRTFFLDWKSDRLPAYDPASLAAHVEANYSLQAKLYTLGVVRMLGIRDARGHDERFGGMVYCFLRGMEPGGDARAGVFFARPTWDEVVAWDDELRSSDEPWGYRLGAARRGAGGAR